ncbi:MAG: helix-turn-helix transcriptional regulator [Parvibaculaceae bacterium]|nr:helix-turn-helix transcriptional regulator [Parvibaculaceae bacterium]
MTTLGERFELVRKHLGGSQRAVAEMVSVSKNTWQRYEKGDVPTGATLLALAAHGINTDWLLTGEGTMLRGALEREAASGFSDLPPAELEGSGFDRGGFVRIPRYDVKVGAGGGTFYEEQNLLGGVAFSREWLHRALRANPADLMIVEAAGDSMPGIADDGALLLLDKSDPVFRGDGAYVFVVDGLLLVKNLRLLLDGSLEVTSGDDHQSTREVIARRDLDKVRIVGRVIWKAGRA